MKVETSTESSMGTPSGQTLVAGDAPLAPQLTMGPIYQRYQILLIGLMMPLFLSGCGRSPTPYGVEYNSSRQATHIPIIPNDWKLYSNIGGIIFWSNPNGWGPPPRGRLTKKVHVSRDGQIMSEVDEYCSGNGFKSLDPDAGSPDWEQMVITYDYVAEQNGRQPWSCEIFQGPRKGTYSLKDAEAILETWSINRIK